MMSLYFGERAVICNSLSAVGFVLTWQTRCPHLLAAVPGVYSVSVYPGGIRGVRVFLYIIYNLPGLALDTTYNM